MKSQKQNKYNTQIHSGVFRMKSQKQHKYNK